MAILPFVVFEYIVVICNASKTVQRYAKILKNNYLIQVACYVGYATLTALCLVVERELLNTFDFWD
jgi:hypothetical protein